MDEHTFILLYESMVHPDVEFANSVSCPYKTGDTVYRKLRKSKRATKLVIKLKNKSHTDRLFYLNLATLKIQTFTR